MPTNDSYYNTWTSPQAEAATKTETTESDPTVPEGEHRARIVGFSCRESKAGDLWMVFEFSILGGLYDGRFLKRLVAPLGRRTDDTDWQAKQAGYARQDLQRILGRVPALFPELVNPDTMSTGPVASEILGAVVTVSVVKKQTDKGLRINVYINDLVSAAEAVADTPPEPPPLPADDAPPPLPAAPSGGGSGMLDPDADLDEIPF